MSVNNGQKTIFCEGKQNSFDYRLLSRVIEDVSEEREIVPAGSKQNTQKSSKIPDLDGGTGNRRGRRRSHHGLKIVPETSEIINRYDGLWAIC